MSYYASAHPPPALPLAGPQDDGDANGMAPRPMTLKVYYTFDKDTQSHLARLPLPLPVQPIPIDERTSIGVVGLNTCLQAIVQNSPELVDQPELDYTVYAIDYSEPDLPLVGHGTLSRLMASEDNVQAYPLTGKISRNLVNVFGNGAKETIEVKLKFAAVPKRSRVEPVSVAMSAQNAVVSSRAPTPTDSQEWNSFVQSNPALGRAAQVTAIPQRQVDQFATPPPSDEHRPSDKNESFGSYFGDMPGHPQGPRRTGSAPTQQLSQHISQQGPQQQLQQQPQQPHPLRNIAPAPSAPTGPPATIELANLPPRPSRPSSRASGRPRGRPRKRPQTTEGNTSGCEEVTDADEGPARKKRATVTTADREPSNMATFTGQSLRVAASTSASLRNIRPKNGPTGAPATGNHLQEGPRAPTPIPAQRRMNLHPRAMSMSGLRRDMYGVGGILGNQTADSDPAVGQYTDARSPESTAVSPYSITDTPFDTPAAFASSPPVPQPSQSPAAFPPSSPTLPPLQHDATDFPMSQLTDHPDEMDSVIGHEFAGIASDQSRAKGRPKSSSAKPRQPRARKPTKKQLAEQEKLEKELAQASELQRSASAPGQQRLQGVDASYQANKQKQALAQRDARDAQAASQDVFRLENPGPRDALPATLLHCEPTYGERKMLAAARASGQSKDHPHLLRTESEPIMHQFQDPSRPQSVAATNETALPTPQPQDANTNWQPTDFDFLEGTSNIFQQFPTSTQDLSSQIAATAGPSVQAQRGAGEGLTLPNQPGANGSAHPATTGHEENVGLGDMLLAGAEDLDNIDTAFDLNPSLPPMPAPEEQLSLPLPRLVPTEVPVGDPTPKLTKHTLKRASIAERLREAVEGVFG